MNHQVDNNQFSSFVWAGFECTYARDENKRRFDLLAASKHDQYCREDYRMIRDQQILTVREGLSWHQIDTGTKHYDFSRFEPMMKIAKEEGIQQIWDLNHFDYPDDIDVFSSQFISRYAEYAKHVIDKIRMYQDGTLYIVPMNEPSFYAWMCDNGLWAPYEKGRGNDFKKQLIKAAIAAMNAILSVDHNVKFIHTDPYMYRQPLRKKNIKEKEFCDNFNEHVKFHSWDMLSGRTDPELGGDPKYMNYIGINYYFYNQQFVGINKEGNFIFRSISLQNKHRLPLLNIIQDVINRYSTNVVITETGSYRDRRPGWWTYIFDEVKNVLDNNLPLYGVCSYPTLDIKKGAGFIVPQSGLWDFNQKDPLQQRIPHEETLQILQQFIKE